MSPFTLYANPAGTPREQSMVTEFYAGSGKATLGNLPAISFEGTNPFTFEMWIYLDALVDRMPLISRAGEFSLETRGATVYAARTNQVVALASDPLLEPHTWYHLALVFDGATMALFLNGRRRSYVTLSDQGVGNKGAPMTIGGGLYGQTDSVRLWNTAIGPGAIYQYQWPDYPANTTGLIAQLDFAQSPPVDTSGHQVPVALTGAVRNVLFTPAATLGGDAFIQPFHDTGVNPGANGQDFTLMAWIAPRLLDTPRVIFANGPLDGPGAALTVGGDGRVSLGIGGATLTSTRPLAAGVWTNVTCGWSATTGAATLFLNGAPDATGTLPPAGQQPSGAPLIGAAAGDGATPPQTGFVGAIQSVSIWKALLSQAQVRQFMTADPLASPDCVAHYALIPPRPQNSSSLKPVGLFGVASVYEMATPAGPLTAGAVAAPGPTRRPPAPPVEETAPSFLTAEDFSSSVRSDWVEEFRTYMADVLGLTDEEQDEFAQRMAANLEQGARRFDEGRLRVPYRITTEDLGDGNTRVTLHHEAESTVVYEGQLDPCVVWAIQFVIAIAAAVWTVFGFVMNLSQVAAGLTNFLGTRIANIGLLPQLQAVFSRGPSPTAVYRALMLLWDFGLLEGIFGFLREAITLSVSIWTMVSLGVRIALLFGPCAPLEIALFLSELGLAIYGIVELWNNPDNCWKSTVPGLSAAAVTG